MGNSLSRKTIIIAVGSGVQSLLTQIGVNVFLVRLLNDQEVFGIYRQVWLVLNTAQPVFLFGVHFSVYYFLPNLADRFRRAFLLRCLAILSVSGVILSLTIYSASGFVATLFSSPALVALLKVVSLYPLFTVPALLLFHFLIAADRALRATIYNTGILLVQAILIVALIANGIDLEKLFFILVFFAVARLCFALFEIRRLTNGQWSHEPGISLGSHLKYAIPMGMTAAVAMVGARLDKFVISGFLDSGAYAVYSVGALEFPIIVLFSTAAGTVMRPRISKLHHEDNRYEIYKFCLEVFRKLSLFLVPMAVFLTVFAPELIQLLYTNAYVEAAAFFRVFLILTLFRVTLFEPVLASVGMTRAVFLGGFWFLILDLILNLLLVRTIGVMGPPVATVLATGFLTLYYGTKTAGYLQKGWSDLLPVTVFYRVFILSGVSVLVASVFRGLDWPVGLVLFSGAMVFGGVYLSLALFTKTITTEDISLIGDWFRRRMD